VPTEFVQFTDLCSSLAICYKFARKKLFSYAVYTRRDRRRNRSAQPLQHKPVLHVANKKLSYRLENRASASCYRHHTVGNLAFLSFVKRYVWVF